MKIAVCMHVLHMYACTAYILAAKRTHVDLVSTVHAQYKTLNFAETDISHFLNAITSLRV